MTAEQLILILENEQDYKHTHPFRKIVYNICCEQAAKQAYSNDTEYMIDVMNRFETCFPFAIHCIREMLKENEEITFLGYNISQYELERMLKNV